MDDSVFAPGTPEAEINSRDGMPLYMEGEKNRMGQLVLTNDRILMGNQKGGTTGNLVGDVIASGLQGSIEGKDGGPLEIARLADLRAGRLRKRRLIPDLYELVLADGRSCRMHRALHKHWDGQIRRLLSERHGMTVTDDDHGWRAEPA